MKNDSRKDFHAREDQEILHILLYHNLVDITIKVINILEVMGVTKGKEQLGETLIIGCQIVKQAISFRFM